MATLYITEFADVGRVGMYGPEPLQIVAQPAKTVQIVTISTSSSSSATFAQGTQIVRLHTDAVCGVTFGTAPNASAATSSRMASGSTEYYAVPLNASYKVAVITNT